MNQNDRFWSKVDTSGDCWTWTAYRNPSGYGIYGLSSAHRGFLAHRFSYELANGPVPRGMVVKHSCDNRACVNPAHLSIGTQAENLAEMTARGRARKARGERSGKAKLTEAAVRDIRLRDVAGEKHPSIARDHGVSISSIWAIARRKHWAHVP